MINQIHSYRSKLDRAKGELGAYKQGARDIQEQLEQCEQLEVQLEQSRVSHSMICAGEDV